MTGSIKK
jgi:hypothetical protein